MSETIAPATSGTAAVPETPVIDTASLYATAREGMTADSWEAPTDGMAVTDGEAETTTETVTPAVDGEFVQDEAGRWHRPDGTFANETELAAITAELAAAPAAETPTEEVAAPEPITLRRRDGTTREVMVDDPELAEEIRTNFNDGMRKKEYTAKMAEAETLASEYREFQSMLRANPEGVILQHLPAEKQISIATQLLAQHFDALIPIIQGYDTNPSSRLTAVTEAQRAVRDQQSNFESLVASQRRAAEIKTAVAGLIPDSAPEDVQEKFWSFAKMTVLAANDSEITKDNVRSLLATVLDHPQFSIYGFGGAAPAAPAKPRITALPVSSSTSPVATPANDAAKQMADAKKTQKRIQLNQRNRGNAAAIPPAGAGAAPLRLPPVPKGASIEEASQDLRKLGRGWR